MSQVTGSRFGREVDNAIHRLRSAERAALLASAAGGPPGVPRRLLEDCERLDEAEMECRRRIHAIESRVEADPAVALMRTRAAGHRAVVGSATRRVTEISAVKDARLRAFTDDPVFSYLLARGAATNGNPLTRLLDAWLAKVSRYEAERRKYDLLSRLPGYLEERRAEAQEALAQTEATLASLRAALLRGNGHVEALSSLTTAKSSAAAARAAIVANMSVIEPRMDIALTAAKLEALRDEWRERGFLGPDVIFEGADAPGGILSLVGRGGGFPDHLAALVERSIRPTPCFRG